MKEMLKSIETKVIEKLRDGGIERRYPRKVDYTIVKFIIRNPLDGKVLKEYEFKKSEFKKLDYEKQKEFEKFEKKEILDEKNYKKAIKEYDKYMEQVKKEHDKIWEEEIKLPKHWIKYIKEITSDIVDSDYTEDVIIAEEVMLKILKEIYNKEIAPLKEKIKKIENNEKETVLDFGL